MKKLLSLAAALPLTLLAFHFASGLKPAAPLLNPLPSKPRSCRRPRPTSPPEADIDKFVTEHANDVATADDPAPQLSPRFGSRPPRQCPVITSPPTSAQAATLVQCTMD